MKKNTFTEILYKNAGYLAVILISLIYVASSLIVIEKTGKSFIEIIGTGVLSLVVGFLITSVFRSIGIRKGDEDEKMVQTTTLHAQAVEDIIPAIDKLDLFCERENKIALKRIRIRILAKAGLKYEECFTEDGVAKELPVLSIPETVDKALKNSIKNQNKKRKDAYHKAVNLKIKPLVASNLTSDGVDADNPFDFGNTKNQYTSKKNVGDLISRVAMAIIFGLFSVTFVEEINFATIIWNALQIIMYLVGGVVQMYASYTWIVDDYRQSIVKKIDYLQKFKNCMHEFDTEKGEENVKLI